MQKSQANSGRSGSGDSSNSSGALARAATQNHPAIESLVDRENWRTWKFKKTFLEVEDFWDVVQPIPNAGWNPLRGGYAKRQDCKILLIDPVNYIHVEEMPFVSYFRFRKLVRTIGISIRDLLSIKHKQRKISCIYAANKVPRITRAWWKLLWMDLPSYSPPAIPMRSNFDFHFWTDAPYFINPYRPESKQKC